MPDGNQPSRVIRPQPGPQEMFLASTADIGFLGGAAGGGKSWSTLIDHLRWSTTPGYSGLIVRRVAKDLTGAGSIWNESIKLFEGTGGRPRESPYLDWRWPSGAHLQFSHAESIKVATTNFEGKNFHVVSLEECAGLDEDVFWLLLSRTRTTDKSFHPYLRGTLNPDRSSFVRKLIDWWIGEDGFPIMERSGVLRWMVRRGDDSIAWADTKRELVDRFADVDEADPKSLTFIPAKLSDNRYLNEGGEYRASLKLLKKYDRERLLGGNWNIAPDSGGYFKREMFEIVEPNEVPSDVLWIARGWDWAASEPTKANPDPDWTRGVKVMATRSGMFYVLDVYSGQVLTHIWERDMKNIAKQDGVECCQCLWQDGGGAAKGQIASITRMLNFTQVTSESAARDKSTYADIWAAQVQNHNVKIVRAGWNDAFIDELCAFPSDGWHDDQVDAMSAAMFMGPTGVRGKLSRRQPGRRGDWGGVKNCL